MLAHALSVIRATIGFRLGRTTHSTTTMQFTAKLALGVVVAAYAGLTAAAPAPVPTVIPCNNPSCKQFNMINRDSLLKCGRCKYVLACNFAQA